MLLEQSLTQNEHMKVIESTDEDEPDNKLNDSLMQDSKFRSGSIQESLKDQLEDITGIQMNSNINEISYNKVIDQCNETDSDVAEFFNSIIANDLK